MRIYLVEKVGYVYENDHLSTNFLSLTNFPSVMHHPAIVIRTIQHRDPLKEFHMLGIFDFFNLNFGTFNYKVLWKCLHIGLFIYQYKRSCKIVSKLFLNYAPSTLSFYRLLRIDSYQKFEKTQTKSWSKSITKRMSSEKCTFGRVKGGNRKFWQARMKVENGWLQLFSFVQFTFLVDVFNRTWKSAFSEKQYKMTV